MAKCWLLFDSHKKGSRHRCIGLAQALDLDFDQRPIIVTTVYRYLPHYLWFLWFLRRWLKQHQLHFPWPAIIICSGRIATLVAAKIKHYFSPNTMVITLQKPTIKATYFDYIICPSHDSWRDTANTLRTIGSLHHVHEQSLQLAAQQIPITQSLPWTLILIGNIKNAAHWPIFIQTLKQWLKQQPQHLKIVPSRRTPNALIDQLRHHFADHDVWLRQAPNPYLAYLAQATQIVVTGDSVNMITESCYTGKPVYIWPLGKYRAKFKPFHQQLVTKGYAAYFITALKNPDFQPTQPLREISRLRYILQPVIQRHLTEFNACNTLLPPI